jgi:protein SCO1/2
MNRFAQTLAVMGCWLAGAACALAHATAVDLGDRVGFTQRLNETVPGTLRFRDATGREVALSDYYGAAPAVLVFAWYGCTTLCPTVVGNLVHALDEGGLSPGRYQVIVASIDPRDSPAAAMHMKRIYLAGATRPGAAGAWHLLTGSDSAISALTQAAGFRYAYDPDSHQYAHPAGIVLLTPQGTISRYFFGFDFTPAQLRDAIDAAAAARIASPVDRLLLLCFHFAPSGRYSRIVLQVLRWTSGALVLAGLILLVAMRWRTTRARARR